MRKVLCCAGAIAGAVLLVGASAASAEQYVVVYKEGASTAAAHQAIRDAGGTIVSENTDVGVATVQSSDPSVREQGRRQVGARTASRPTAPSATRRRGEKPAWRDVESEQWQLPRQRPAPAAGERRSARRRCSGTCSSSAPRRRARTPRPGQPRRPRRDHGHRRRRQAPRHRAELRPLPEPQLHGRQLRARHRRRPVRAPVSCVDPPTRTTTATARTWPAPSARRSTASAWPASPRRSTS